MPRIRSIKIGFFTNEQLCRLSADHRLLFEGLWLLADREGRLKDRPGRIRAELFPYHPELDVDAMLSDIARQIDDDDRPFLLRYEVDGARYLQIVSFPEHQRPKQDEAASKIPPPPSTARAALQEVARHLGATEMTVCGGQADAEQSSKADNSPAQAPYIDDAAPVQSGTATEPRGTVAGPRGTDTEPRRSDTVPRADIGIRDPGSGPRTSGGVNGAREARGAAAPHGAPLIGRFQDGHGKHAACDEKLSRCVPDWLHRQFRDRLAPAFNGDRHAADQALRAWYPDVWAQLGPSDVVPDPPKFWQPLFDQRWVSHAPVTGGAASPPEDRWTRVLARLRPKVSRHDWHSWFEPLTLARADGPVLVLAAPDPALFGDWIQRHFRPVLQDALDEERRADPATRNGGPWTVQFVAAAVPAAGKAARA